MRLQAPQLSAGRRGAGWGRVLVGPVGAVAGVLILAGLLRLVEVFLYSAFKKLHVPSHFKDIHHGIEARMADPTLRIERPRPLSQEAPQQGWEDPMDPDLNVMLGEHHAHGVGYQHADGVLMRSIGHGGVSTGYHSQEVAPQPQQPALHSGGWATFEDSEPLLATRDQLHQTQANDEYAKGLYQQHGADLSRPGALQLQDHAPEKLILSKPAGQHKRQQAEDNPRAPPAPLEELKTLGLEDMSNLPPQPIVASSFIVSDNDPNKVYTNHASTIVQVGKGELLATWFGGTDENAPDVSIWTSRFSSGRWGPATEVVAPFTRDHSICGKHFSPPVPCKWQNSTWNPVLHRMPDGELLLFYKTGPHPSEWQGWLKRSRDSGHTWGPAEPLPVTGPAKHKPLMLPSGVLLAGASTESGKASEKRLWQCWIDATADGGRTWQRHGPLPFDGNIIQPSLWIGDDMSVHMMARTATDYDKSGKRADPVKNKKEMIYRGSQYLIHAKSDTTGLYWPSPGKPVFDLPSPNAAGDVVKLRDGRLLVIYNHSKERKALGRSTLLVSMSEDGGEHWQVVLELEDGPPNDITQEYSYPAIIQADDDTVHITYTFRRRNIRHVMVDPRVLKPLPGKKFGKEYSGVRGHYDTTVFASSLHHAEQDPSGGGKAKAPKPDQHKAGSGRHGGSKGGRTLLRQPTMAVSSAMSG